MQPANNFIVLNIREYLENKDKRLDSIGGQAAMKMAVCFLCLILEKKKQINASENEKNIYNRGNLRYN